MFKRKIFSKIPRKHPSPETPLMRNTLSNQRTIEGTFFQRLDVINRNPIKLNIARIEGKTPSKRQANIIRAPNAKTADISERERPAAYNGGEVINGVR